VHRHGEDRDENEHGAQAPHLGCWISLGKPLRDGIVEREQRRNQLRVGVALDGLAGFPLPDEKLPEQPEHLARLNELWERPPGATGSGLGATFRRKVEASLAPTLERQQTFNSLVVQVLNGHLDETAALHSRLRQVVGALIGYAQRVLPTVDARDRSASARATTRAELILESFDRRQEALGRRLEGLLALRDRIEAISEEVRALRGTLAAAAQEPPLAAAAERAAGDSAYVAFENRFRGSPDEIASRLADYVELFRERAPVVDLGCGRGEFLELLKKQGVPAHGVESNALQARSCRERGLDVVDGDLVAFLKLQAEGSLGGVFAAQVAEHLPPTVLQELLRESHRALRVDGLLVLETVNPRSVTGLLEVFNRDLTHEKPLHPETLRFLATAAGFSDVRIGMRSPVETAAQLQEVPVAGLPEAAARALNENVTRLNELLYGPLEYALVARR